MGEAWPDGTITAVSRTRSHRFSKDPQFMIRLLAGVGVDGDAHSGPTVKHRSRVRVDPGQPNLRQVHLIDEERLETLRRAGFAVGPGALGENVTTRGLDLLALPTDTLLRLGDTAIIRVTGLRNPCVQLDRYQSGLMAAMLDRDPQGQLIRKAGIMSVVVAGGDVRPGDPIGVEIPAGPHRRLAVV